MDTTEKTTSIEEMIAGCQEGVYVNRLSDVFVIDWKTGMMTGVTRDGCFFIKNGKIDRPIKNFRFTDSPFFAFNNLEAIGTPVRAAFGYTPPSPREFASFAVWPPVGRATRWPRVPLIVPALMIRDFNFTGLVDAV